MRVSMVNTDTGEVIGETEMDEKEALALQKPNDKPKDDNNKKNKDYVMMYRQFINQIADLGQEDPQALKILLFLCRNMDYRNALCITMGLIAEMTNICRQTVSKKLKYLEDNGWICIAKLGKANVYIINPDVVWTAYAPDKTYCRFKATVMLDANDNWNFKYKDKASIRHIDKNILQKIDEMAKESENESA